MDVNSQARDGQKQKTNEGLNIVSDTNGLGNLPDEIVEHIISLLPTKDAVRTSILSKSWQNKWTHSSNLEFVEEGIDRRESFFSFVQRVLDLHGSSDIQKLSLSCVVLKYESQIFEWISTAITHNVQRLKLCLNNLGFGLTFPPCLFTCATLTVLELNLSGETLKLPSEISYPSLRILSLKHLILPDDHLMQCLFSGCPVLEELLMHDCNWKNVEAICISCPMLKKLAVNDRKFDVNDDMDEEDYNAVEYAWNDSNGCRVVIIGTSLEYFSYTGELRNDYCLYDSSSLIKAWIDVDGERNGRGNIPRAVGYRAFELVRAFFNVRNLTISADTLEIFCFAEELLMHMPEFENLTFLQTNPHATVLLTIPSLLKIMQNAPRLGHLRFAWELMIDNVKGERWTFNPVPPCFSTNLKTLEIGFYNGEEMQLDAVEVLLKSSTVLQTLELGGAKPSAMNDMAKQQLLRLPRGSNCKIVFH